MDGARADPNGTGDLNRLAPAGIEAVNRYMKLPSAGVLEFGFCPTRAIGRSLHLLQQKSITPALPRVLGEWPYERTVLGQVRRANRRRGRFQACGRKSNGRFLRWHARD